MVTENKAKGRICVVVLGDWGRSPRMQYHALSLANNGYTVDVVAYEGAEPHVEVRKHKHIKLLGMKDVPNFQKYFPRFIVYFLKTLWQSFFLFTVLLSIQKPQVLLLQNPPSIPTLPVSWFVCFIRRCKLVIDYHNYGFTILGLSLGKKHILVKISKWCEKYFGKKAIRSLCVTEAMKEDLKNNWDVQSTVFYDCPPQMFHPISTEEKHLFFMKLGKEYTQFLSRADIRTEKDCNEYSRFTNKVGNKVELLNNRPALIVSSTSWTEDEDFSVLLNALQDYENSAAEKDLPNLLVAITGKGPLKSYYEDIIGKKGFSHIEIITLWLQAEDYPTFLACADIGVCLHNSSSGLDLPMKVVDMFGCGLPVCAVSYKCLDELVKHGVNGLIFSDSKQLNRNLQNLLRGFPKSAKELKMYRTNLTDAPLLRWNDSWEKCALPLFLDLTT